LLREKLELKESLCYFFVSAIVNQYNLSLDFRKRILLRDKEWGREEEREEKEYNLGRIRISGTEKVFVI